MYFFRTRATDIRSYNNTTVHMLKARHLQASQTLTKVEIDQHSKSVVENTLLCYCREYGSRKAYQTWLNKASLHAYQLDLNHFQKSAYDKVCSLDKQEKLLKLTDHKNVVPKY